MMQLLHSAYDLQEAISWAEFMAVLELSVPYVKDNLSCTDDRTFAVRMYSGPLRMADAIFFDKFKKIASFGISRQCRHCGH